MKLLQAVVLLLAIVILVPIATCTTVCSKAAIDVGDEMNREEEARKARQSAAAERPDPEPAPTTGTACGQPAANPGVDADAWADHRCQTRTQAGARWRECLRRRDYTRKRAGGCPGAERCCPAR